MRFTTSANLNPSGFASFLSGPLGWNFCFALWKSREVIAEPVAWLYLFKSNYSQWTETFWHAKKVTRRKKTTKTFWMLLYYYFERNVHFILEVVKWVLLNICFKKMIATAKKLIEFKEISFSIVKALSIPYFFIWYRSDPLSDLVLAEWLMLSFFIVYLH